MNYLELAMISFALAADAAAYAFSYGLILRQRKRGACLALATITGLFQAGMPLLGYMGGVRLREVVMRYGEWVTCLIFVALGVSTIGKAWRESEGEREVMPLGIVGLLIIGLATSMDAFAVGICLALGRVLNAELTASRLALVVGCIGLVTFVSVVVSFRLARLMHHFPIRWLQTAAGALLLILGVQALT